MLEKNRIKSLSTRYLLLYKLIIWMILLLAFGGLIYSAMLNFSSKLFLSGLLLPLSWSYILYRSYLVSIKLYQVEFDDAYFYVIQRNQDMLVPLENIKDIELKSLTGHWEVIFYNPEQLGDKIYFKPSLLYPFNSKKKDELVNLLWSNIEKAKSKKQSFQKNALHS